MSNAKKLAEIKLLHEKSLITVIEAFLAGKSVQKNVGFSEEPDWRDFKDDDAFIMHPVRYRIKPSTPDSIDWSHVNPYFKFMARDASGGCYLYGFRPSLDCIRWNANDPHIESIAKADNFASYVEGDAPWNESLVERPA